MEIDELEGRELTEAVCEARGLKLLTRQSTYSAYASIDGSPQHDIIVRCDEPLDPEWRPPGYRPDRNIAQAWELVDVLWEDKKDFDISREGNDLWWLSIHDLKWCNEETNSYKILVSEMMHGTAPEVICRAFLEAKAAQ